VHLTQLRLRNYRNIEELDLSPSRGTNLFSGQNGQGKTNLLESIYLLAYGKSYRTATPRACIRHDREECWVEGTVEQGSLKRDLKISITQSEKKLFVLGKPARIEEFVGKLPLQAFTHEHLRIVRGGPADRRAFLDRAMVILYPGHVVQLVAYERFLKQKNKVLAAAREGRSRIEGEVLDSWDEALAKAGARILWNRRRYTEQMKEELPQGLFGAETLKMHYLSTIPTDNCDVGDMEQEFHERLRHARESDLRTGYTSVGPHRDDLKLYVNGKSLGDFGSAGQQRSSLLALYFSQMEIHRKTQGTYPIFLVDDAEAELDEQRLRIFLRYIAERTQLFLTSAKGFLLPFMPANTRCYDVAGGAIAPGIGIAPGEG
jgi:DNA replication and repair protein RecF